MTELCFSPWYWRGAVGRCHLLRLSAICQDKVKWRNCVSARGIDVEQLDGVISYDCPPFVKTYIHRPVHMYLFINWAFPYPPELLWENICPLRRGSSCRWFSTFVIILFRWRNNLTSVHLDQNKKSDSPSYVGCTCQKHITLGTVPLNITIAVHSHLTQSSFFLFLQQLTLFLKNLS